MSEGSLDGKLEGNKLLEGDEGRIVATARVGVPVVRGRATGIMVGADVDVGGVTIGGIVGGAATGGGVGCVTGARVVGVVVVGM